MFMPNNDTNSSQSNSLTSLLLLITASLLCFTQATASELNAKQYSSSPNTVSQGMIKAELNEQQRIKIIKTNKLADVPDQLNGKATTQSRRVMLKNQKALVHKALTQNKNNLNSAQNDYADFVIYNATSYLQDDYDDDGFYQTFSVTFDADIYSYNENQLGEVYALLYISKNGGPWTHYFTTDSFLIEGDSEGDEYEVITTFLSGYASDYYDVLIDLYQVGYSDVVATYSSDDSNALYALPLESSDYNEPYYIETVEVIEVSGGSMVWLILFLLGFSFIRLKTFN
ncbi:MAG: choice-of-anchor H family protein [Colwellia sp.]|nr:choice-of-anchor H family protein [Colwellia sp.]